ncbi:MAG: hypothetical protein LR015_04155 [Verrucomicrobia bacterium]|nr:hypothetical protein [Verrucomicrobiota bacterium]
MPLQVVDPHPVDEVSVCDELIPAAGNQPAMNERPAQVLLLEGSLSFRRITLLFLEQLQASVRSVKSVDELKLAVDSGSFDCIMIDFELGHAQLVRLAAYLGRLTGKLEGVALVGVGEMPADLAGVHFDATVQKPLTREKLRDAMVTTLARRNVIFAT